MKDLIRKFQISLSYLAIIGNVIWKFSFSSNHLIIEKHCIFTFISQFVYFFQKVKKKKKISFVMVNASFEKSSFIKYPVPFKELAIRSRWCFALLLPNFATVVRGLTSFFQRFHSIFQLLFLL